MPDLILEDGGSMVAAGYMRLPPGWVGVIGDSRWAKPYGWYDRRERVIEVHAPAWLPEFLRPKFHRIIWAHEALHACGNPGCERPWCLGYEAERIEHGAKRYSIEYLAMPLQLLAGLRFCDTCKSYELRINP